jgi:hypothetical protein
LQVLELPKNDVPGPLEAPLFVHMHFLVTLRLQNNRLKGVIPASVRDPKRKLVV